MYCDECTRLEDRGVNLYCFVWAIVDIFEINEVDEKRSSLMLVELPLNLRDVILPLIAGCSTADGTFVRDRSVLRLKEHIIRANTPMIMNMVRLLRGMVAVDHDYSMI